jgi:hypothetical protein
MEIQLTTPAARRTVAASLLLGLLADLLLRSLPWGVNASLWMLAFAAAAVMARGTARGPLVAAALFAMVFAWRSSPTLLVLCGAAVFVAVSVALLERPGRSGLVPYALAAFATVAGSGLGSALAVPAAARGAPGPRGAWRPIRPAVVGSLLATPFLLVFGGLFATADPLFSHAVRDVVLSVDQAAEHGAFVAMAAWLAGGALVALGLHRFGPDLGVPSPRRGGGEILVALLLVDLLFAAFLLVQARALLGGREFVEATIGLSYAEYAREGFFQLVATAAIALPMLLAADWAVPPGTPRRRRWVLLAGALTLMVLAVLVSAARRMALYVEVYGLTELRLTTSAFMIWLAVTGVVFAATVLRGSRERFAFTSLSAAGALLAGLVILNPDAAIVRFNAERASSSSPGFDVRYALSLSADAVPELLEVLPRLDRERRCGAAVGLLAEWAEASPPEWRSWNAGRERARRRVAASRDELEATVLSCPGATLPLHFRP